MWSGYLKSPLANLLKAQPQTVKLTLFNILVSTWDWCVETHLFTILPSPIPNTCISSTKSKSLCSQIIWKDDGGGGWGKDQAALGAGHQEDSTADTRTSVWGCSGKLSQVRIIFLERWVAWDSKVRGALSEGPSPFCYMITWDFFLKEADGGLFGKESRIIP